MLGGTSTVSLLLVRDLLCALKSSPIFLGSVRDFNTKLIISSIFLFELYYCSKILIQGLIDLNLALSPEFSSIFFLGIDRFMYVQIKILFISIISSNVNAQYFFMDYFLHFLFPFPSICPNNFSQELTKL